MSTYHPVLANRDEFLGNAFTDFMAKLDPTSSKIGGQVVKGVISAAGTLVGIPPAATFASLTVAGKVRGSMMNAKKLANSTLPVTMPFTTGQIASVSVPSNVTPVGGMAYDAQPKTSPVLPISIAAGAGILLIAVFFALKK